MSRLLVDDLLLLAHHERRDVDREPIFLSQVVSETIEDFSAFAKKNNVSLMLEMSSEIKVIGDAAALRRALANLLSNAIRITGSEKSGGQIKVVGGQDADQVWVSVEDNGPGLSTEDIERVFQRFWKGNVSEAKESGRSGLGLFIVRQIVGRSWWSSDCSVSTRKRRYFHYLVTSLYYFVVAAYF